MNSSRNPSETRVIAGRRDAPSDHLGLQCVYPPAEPGALGDEPLKAAEGRCRGPNFKPSIPHTIAPIMLTPNSTTALALEILDIARCAPYIHPAGSSTARRIFPSRHALSCACRLARKGFADGLPEMSNCCCHPGRAGGSPLVG